MADEKSSDKPHVSIREIGSTGLPKSAGVVLDEFLPDLQGARGQKRYREMSDNDPVLSGMMYTFEMLFRQSRRTVRPAEMRKEERDRQTQQQPQNAFAPDPALGPNAGDPIDTMSPEQSPLPDLDSQVDSSSKEAEEIAAFVEECMDDLSHSFEDFMSQVASMFIYGWDAHEIVYKRREGYHKRGSKNSKFDDNKVGWGKFGYRDQRSLWEWEFDKNGGLRAFQQIDEFLDNPNHFGPRRIPIEKMLLFRTSTKNTSPEGRSLLRGAYRPWYFKKRIEEIEAIGIERDLAGMPVIYAPSSIFSKDATDDEKALFAALQNAVKNIRRDEQDGLVFPLEYDDNGKELYRFELASTGGRRQLDTDEIIKRKNMEMAMSVLADFMLLGHEQVGSFALSQDKTNLFTLALDGHLISVAQTFIRHAIPRLLRLNGMPVELTPIVTFEPVRAPTLAELGEFIQRLARAGAPFFPDENLQAWLHERAGMPPPAPALTTMTTGLMANGQPGNDGGHLPEGQQQIDDPFGSPTAPGPGAPKGDSSVGVDGAFE